MFVWLLKRDKGRSHRHFINKLLTPFSLTHTRAVRERLDEGECLAQVTLGESAGLVCHFLFPDPQSTNVGAGGGGHSCGDQKSTSGVVPQKRFTLVLFGACVRVCACVRVRACVYVGVDMFVP